MLTSEMLSMLSTCTSMPTGIAEPGLGVTDAKETELGEDHTK